MANHTDAATDAHADDDSLVIDELEAGDELEIGYRKISGSTHSLTAQVVQVERDVWAYSGDYHRHEITLVEPGARRPRFLQIEGDADDGVLDMGTRTTLYSVSGGQKLGKVTAVTPTGGRNEHAVSLGALLGSEEGDVLRVDGERAVVTEIEGQARKVETDDGTRYQLRKWVEGVNCREQAPGVDSEIVAVEATGESVEAPAEAEELLDRLASYGHGEHEKVEAVVIDGTRHDVKYRHDGDSEGIRFDAPDVEEHPGTFDRRLRVDPLGLRLETFNQWGLERLQAAEITLITESDDEESEELAADGGQEIAADGGVALDGELSHEDLEAFDAEEIDSGTVEHLGDARLDELDERLGELLNGDPFAFPSDDALQAAFALSSAVRDERQNRDPRRDDPHFLPDDSVERFDVPISRVETEPFGAAESEWSYSVTLVVDVEGLDGVEPEGDTERLFTFVVDDDGVPTQRGPRLEPVLSLVLDYHDLEPGEHWRLADCGLPVVGAREEGVPFSRVDRYALEHGEPALGSDEDPDGADGVCSRCAGSGEIVKMIDGRSGLVRCPSCDGGGGADLDQGQELAPDG